MLADPLNSRGAFSDGDDGRLDTLPSDLESLRGAFRTPSLRCVALRPSFMHAGQLRSLEAAVSQKSEGPDPLGQGYQGTPDPDLVPLGWSLEDRDAVVAFLRTLTGPGPETQLLQAPD
jgi:cytochrome c peroxidase